MWLRRSLVIAFLGIFASGCASGPHVAGLTKSLPGAETPPRTWDWVTALPHGASRAEVVVPTVDGTALAKILPQCPQPEVRLASVPTPCADYRITAVNDFPVANFNQLHAAVNAALDGEKKITVRLAAPGASAESQTSVSIQPSQLIALSQAAAPQQRLLRVTEDGNPWVLLRQDGVRCKVGARVERQHCLMQVAVGLAVCWGPQVGLPGEIRATCDGVPLQCLSVAATLDKLYAGREASDTGPGADGCSFVAVSERDNYRIPTNYKRLQQAADDPRAHSLATPATPALVSLAGLPYPGPALLGDARALSAFMMQRQLCQPGEPERVGWIIFSGEALRSGTVINLDIDLGQGAQRLTFTLPGA